MTNHGRNSIHHNGHNGRNREVDNDTDSSNNNIITELLPSDILCGKDKTYGKHPGNQVYRRLIEERAIAYASTGMSKQIKMGVTKEIVAQLTAAGARFLRKKIDMVEAWEEISNQQARDKTSHALRFCAKYHGTTQKKRILLLPSSAAVAIVPSSTSSTTANPTTTKHHHHHRRMVSSETLGSMDHPPNNDNAIAIFQRQQAILNQSLNGHRHHRPAQYGRQYSGSKAVWEQPRGGCDDNDEEDDLALLHPQQQRHRRHHEDSKPDGVVSSSRDLADILQEPLHESMNEDGDWDGYFIQPSASS